jgi:peptidoglycan/xylan/chitin deacetylase (PgdA/CDA1 family)
MKLKKITRLALILLTLIAVTGIAAAQRNDANGKHREIAVTFDDLPVASSRQDRQTWEDITTRLLKTIETQKIPTVAFVNENKLYQDGKLDQVRVTLLKRWLDGGIELGNHTFSHRSLNAIPLAEFESDVLRGEEVMRGLITERGKSLRYFRHPFLHTGRSLETRRDFESFLAAHGYTVAPVTIDNSDWIYASAYDKAHDANDAEAMKRVAAAYLPYMEAKLDYYEKQSTALFGREISQILLVHANAINADHFGDLVTIMRKRGYNFITLSQALQDPAYKSPDTFVGQAGITWLHRWAITRGVPDDFFKGEPVTPEFVMKLAGVTSE